MKTSIFNIQMALAIIVIVITQSCKKDESQDQFQINKEATHFSSLKIDHDFNWSSSLKGNLTITIHTKDDLFIEGQPVQIVNKMGVILDQSFVQNGVANFYVHLPQSAEAYVLYPSTGDFTKINSLGNITLELTSLQQVLSGSKKAMLNAKKAVTTTGTNLLANSGFSQQANVITNLAFDYTKPTAVDGKWHIGGASYELNTTLVLNDTVLKLSLDGRTIYWGQTVNVVAGSPFTISSVWQNTGRRIVVSYFDSSDNFIGYSYPSLYGVNVGGQHSGTIPANAVKALIWSSGALNSYVDDVVFVSSPTISDADGDGVVDNLDQFPNDPNRAYQSSFPTLGNQFLAFEDLWPATGDFDFNDLVVKNSIVYTKNANNYLVDATITIDLNAVGAGLKNGLGLVFLNTAKQEYNNSIVSGVSGDAAINPNLTNGIVIFSDVFAAQSTYYTNTGTGKDAAPDQFQFTITFVPNSVKSIIPDFYLFRRDDMSHEIHLDGFSPTSAANSNLLNTVDDHNGTYNTENGLPWAIEVVTPAGFRFRHSLEKIDILESYPQFKLWATTKGAVNAVWFENPIDSKVY